LTSASTALFLAETFALAIAIHSCDRFDVANAVALAAAGAALAPTLLVVCREGVGIFLI
jgi:uncharacterized iron-regulated membrane protein